MADLNAILKNKMGLSVEQAKKSKILASLSGSYRQNMKSIHYSQLVPSTNQFYTEKELEELDLAAEVLTPGRLAEDAALLVCLPSVDEVPDDLDDIESEDLHLASGMLVDLDDTGKSLARYLIFFSQIRVKLENPDEQCILKMVNFMNRTSRVGHYFYGSAEEGQEPLVQYRATVTGVSGEPFDAGVVADTVLEMGMGYDLMKEMLLKECTK